MNEIQYKGYAIRPHPEQLVKNGKWTVNISVAKHRSDSVSNRRFSASNTFPTKEEATAHCFSFGKQIVDGQIKNCSVDDL